jgi:hypothetical protein
LVFVVLFLGNGLAARTVEDTLDAVERTLLTLSTGEGSRADADEEEADASRNNGCTCSQFLRH